MTTQTLATLIDTIIDGLNAENALLRKGQVQDALKLTAEREKVINTLDDELKRRNNNVQQELEPAIRKLQALNNDNAMLLQAAQRGQAMAKQRKAVLGRAAGYGPTGARIHPDQPKTLAQL